MIRFSPSTPKRDWVLVLLTSVTTGTARTVCTTGCWTATTRDVVLCWDPKESATVVLMKGVNWEMILATRSESVFFLTGVGLGAGLGAGTITSVFTGLDLIDTNPCRASLVSE